MGRQGEDATQMSQQHKWAGTAPRHRMAILLVASLSALSAHDFIRTLPRGIALRVTTECAGVLLPSLLSAPSPSAVARR